MFPKAKQTSHSFQVHKSIRQPLAILNACHPGAWEKVGGIPLTARTLFHLKELEIKKVVVLLSMDRTPLGLQKWHPNLELHQMTATEDVPATILSIAGLEPHFLYLDTAHLIDPRIIHALTVASGTTLAYTEPADREKQVVRAGFIKIEGLRLWAKEGKASLIRKSKTLYPGDLDPFSPRIRGPVKPYFLEVRSRDEARKATRILIRSKQKQVMDLPAQFIDPPFENALTLILCNTPITPNMVTLFGLAVAAGVAWLFWHGYFVLGAFCTFLVEILDGVDGKLADTRLQFTKFGQYEHIIDYIYENSWYVCLAVGLRATVSNNLPVLLAVLLILSDTADNIFYTLAGKWYGKSIDLFSPFDAAFRRIAGRRNIYGFMFIIGFSVGYPLLTFAAVAIWAALTAGIHGFRLTRFGKTRKKAYGKRAKRAL